MKYLSDICIVVWLSQMGYIISWMDDLWIVSGGDWQEGVSWQFAWQTQMVSNISLLAHVIFICMPASLPQLSSMQMEYLPKTVEG